jgi:hypothetical protein
MARVKLCSTFGILVALACCVAAMTVSAHAAPVSDAGAAQFWFDASRPSTLFQNSAGTTAVTTSGNPVGYWGNSSSLTGDSRNATQATGTARPTWQTNVINGKAVVRFDGNDWLNTGAISGLNTANLTWFTVSRTVLPSTNSANIMRSSYSGGATVNTAHLWGTFADSDSISGTATYMASARAADGTLRGGRAAAVSNAATIVTGRWNGTTDVVNAWSNGSFQVGTASAGATGADANPSGHQLTRLGASSVNASGTTTATGGFLNGDIAEAMVFNTVFNTAQRTVMENYLGAKYAINLTSDQAATYQSLNATYRNDVIGIGKASDASTSLLSGLSGLQLAATALTNANAWLFAGNGDAYNSATSIQTANALVQTNLPTGVSDRWSRVWNLETINTIASGDSLGITFDWNAGGLGASFDATDTFALLYSSTSSPTTFTKLVASHSSLDAANKTVRFNLSGATLADGYYTVAIVPEPSTAMLGVTGLGGLAVGILRRRQARGR